MTYLVEQVLRPRAFVYTCNAEALVLESTTPETRLTFLNSMRSSSALSPNFAIASSNTNLHVLSDNTILSTFNVEYDPLIGDVQPQFTTEGSAHAKNFSILPGGGTKAFVLKDFNQSSPNLYAGIEYSGGTFTNQLPSRTSYFAFQAAAADGINAEWVRIQESAIGVPQVGIGTIAIDQNVALAVGGNTQISGSLKVSGALEFNPTSFSNYIQYDTATQRLPNAALPENVPLLNQNNKIDESLIPQSFNFQYMKSQKNVGIGTRHPEQKFHVHGSGVFSERIGIGTLKPATRCHIIESSGTIPAARIQSVGGGAVIEALLGDSTAMILPGTHPSMGIGTSIVPVGTGLWVEGDATLRGELNISGSFACSNISSIGKVSGNELDILGNVLKTGLKSSTRYGLVHTVESSAPVILTNELSVNSISATTDYGRVLFRNSSIYVEAGTYLATQPVTLADTSTIFTQVPINSATAVEIIKDIQGYTYSLGGNNCAGLIGNELLGLSGQPPIVSVMPDGKYGVRYESLIPYLIESIKNLEQRVRALEGN